MRLRRQKKGAAPSPLRYDEATPRQRAVTLVILALVMTLIVELCNRGLSIPRLFQFITGSPLIFLLNVLIVLTSLVFSELFLHRIAMLGTICLLWLFFDDDLRNRRHCKPCGWRIDPAFRLFKGCYTGSVYCSSRHRLCSHSFRQIRGCVHFN